MSKQNNNNQGEPPVVDLLSVLSNPVEDNSRDPLFTLDTSENVQDAVFDEYEQIQEQEQEYQQQQQSGAASDYMPPMDIAETVVNLLDGLQSSVVPFLLEKKLFTQKEAEVLQLIDLSGNTTYQPAGSIENMVLAKWKAFQKKVEQIPFNKGEKSRLIAATARYAETTEMKVSPLAGLMMAYSEVILKRSAYFFKD